MRKRLLVVLLAAAACGPRAAPAGPAPPPTDAPGWEDTHRLIDLFDTARLGRDPARRKELLETLGLQDDGDQARGRTTDAVLDALLVRVDRILAASRLHAGAQAARTLLELDRRPPAARAELFGRMTTWKGIARGGGPLAPNATLRLWSFCERALRDAAGAPARDQPAMISMCLYPLYDADPEPYFAADPARRPPPPEWQELLARLRSLGEGLKVLEGTRLAALRAPLLAGIDAFAREAEEKELLPRPLDPRAMGVPLVVDPAIAAPYDGEPLVLVREPTADELAKFTAKLVELLGIDGRGRAALALASAAPAKGFLELAAMLRRQGADTVELAVGWTQEVRAPSGDYWHERSPDGRVLRLGVLPLRLDPARLGPRASLGLILSVAPRSWRIVAPSGAMPGIPLGADAAPARAALRAQLVQLLDAFPDTGALAVAPDPSVTAAALATAIQAASVTADGRPLVGELALAIFTAPGAPRGDLAERAARRSAARVAIVPDALDGKTAGVRRCYQDALDRAPSLAGTLALELDGAKARYVAGPDDAPLRACVLGRLEPAMVEGGMRSVRVELSH